MKKINFRLFLVGSMLASPLLAEAASFDCTKAGSEIEKSICANEVLSKLDEELASSYRSAKGSSADPDKLLADQRIWIRSRNACKNDECLKNSYDIRLEQLRKADSSLNKPTVNNEAPPAEVHTTHAPTPVVDKPSTEAPVKTDPPAPPTVVNNSAQATSTKTEVSPKENKNSSENNEKISGFSFVSILNNFLRIVAAGLLLFTFFASYKAIKKKGNWSTAKISFIAVIVVSFIGMKLTGDSSSNSSSNSSSVSSGNSSGVSLKRSTIEAEVAKWQTNPEGVEFGELTIIQGKVACLGVNVQNKFGGYVGERQAIVVVKNGAWAWIDNFQLNHNACLNFARQFL